MKRSSRAGRLTQLERNQRTTGIFFILPSLVLCAIFMVVPLINVIRYSLTDWDGLSKTYNFVGLYNYMHLHEIEGFGEMMLATVTFAIGVTAITIIVSFLAALALDKRGSLGLGAVVDRDGIAGVQNVAGDGGTHDSGADECDGELVCHETFPFGLGVVTRLNTRCQRLGCESRAITDAALAY